MSLAIRSLLDCDATPDVAAIDAFLEANRSPIVEGSSVTFLFRGDVEAVRLRHFIHGFPRKQPFHRVEGTDLWFLTMEIPPESRMEYKIGVRRKRRWRMIRDPLNAAIAHDPFGANSVCQGAGYERPDWTLPDPEAREGKVDVVGFRSDVHSADAEVAVYLPPRLRTSRLYPLLIAFDGEDYARFAALTTVLDNLIHRYEIPPLVVAMSSSPDRFGDYTSSEDHARFVADDLLPALQREFPLRDRVADRGLMGASLGAVAAFWTAWKRPELFGRLLLQSGSFRFNDTGYEEHHPALGPVVDFVNGYRAEPKRMAGRIYVSCGRYEPLIQENRALVPLLRRTGMEVRYEENRDGHNWENWRDRLRAGLTWLFPGPLGLVYE